MEQKWIGWQAKEMGRRPTQPTSFIYENYGSGEVMGLAHGSKRYIYVENQIKNLR
jgi:hypothetical protein